MKRFAFLLAALPMPIFSGDLPMPQWSTTVLQVPVSAAVMPAVKLIAGVPYDRRLAGPQNWFRCPHCGRSDCWMFLGNALRREFRVTDAELDRAGYRNWGVLYDNLHNKDWKPPKAQPTVQQSGCEGGTCRQGPVRRILGRWR